MTSLNKSTWYVMKAFVPFCQRILLFAAIVAILSSTSVKNWLRCSVCDLLATLSRSTRQCERDTVHNGAHGCHDHELATVPRVPYQALLLLRFFAYNICTHEKVRKGEGEPGNEAKILFSSRQQINRKVIMGLAPMACWHGISYSCPNYFGTF